MSDKIILLKYCGNIIYGVDDKKNIYKIKNNEKELELKTLDFTHDFCFIDDELYYIKDRKIISKKGEIRVEFDYPIKIKQAENNIYVLDQEKSSILKYDKKFNIITTIGNFGNDKLEKKEELFFHFPIDFDVISDIIGVIDTGNRRTVILKNDNKIIFPVIGKKIQFYNENIALILYGEIIYKLVLNEKNIYRTEYEGITDFCINHRTKDIVILKE